MFPLLSQKNVPWNHMKTEVQKKSIGKKRANKNKDTKYGI